MPPAILTPKVTFKSCVLKFGTCHQPLLGVKHKTQQLPTQQTRSKESSSGPRADAQPGQADVLPDRLQLGAEEAAGPGQGAGALLLEAEGVAGADARPGGPG